MKRFFIWCIPLFISIIAIGITFVIINANRSSNTIYATKFNYRYANILNLKPNDEVTFNKTEFDIEPTNCTERIILATNDNDIIDIDSVTNKITAKKTGTCTLFAYIKSGATETLTTQIIINITNESNDDNKTIETYNYTFLLENGLTTIEFNAGSSKYENEINIISGNEHIDIFDEEYNRISLMFKSTGISIIEIVCNNKKLILNITIE